MFAGLVWLPPAKAWSPLPLVMYLVSRMSERACFDAFLTSVGNVLSRRYEAFLAAR